MCIALQVNRWVVFDFTLGSLAVFSQVLGYPSSAGIGSLGGVGLHSNQILIGYSLKVCAMFSLA